MPVTAHPGHSKAFHYFDIDYLLAPVDENQKVDVQWVADHIGPNTVALVGSAGTYPHGVIDPIPELGQLALQHGIGLHVDGCLGGFILAWAKDCGYEHTPFDMSVPGVTSMSADTHKYGYALKGSSVLLFRPKSLRREQYLLIDSWPGGAYASPGMGGSRSGGLISATWASMLSYGKSGYRAIAKDIFRTADEIRAAVVSHDSLKLVGDSLWNIAFTSDELNIFHVNDGLADLGWRMNGLQLPPALHFCITRPNTKPGITEEFAVDLAKAVSYAQNPPNPKPRSGAMYGADGTARAPIDKMRESSANRLDALHEVGPLS
jgi:glutamate/tyrosine decarboxylase-like PLP-dependent enzyme